MTPSPGLIPDQLSDSIKKGDCVLFLGADLPLGYAGAPLSRPELAAALAHKYDLPPGRSWPETASAYLGKYRNDRNGLIRFLMEHASGPDARAGDLHHAIARAGFRAIVSAWYDELLEQTLRKAGYRVHRVVRDVQAPYSGQGERDVTLVKLFGCLSDPDSLLLNKREHIQLIDQLGQKLTAVISYAVLRPLLFVGHDLSDQTLMALYNKAAAGVVRDMRRAYAVWPQPTDAMRADWVDINLEFLSQQPTPFLQALAVQTPPAEQPAAPIRAHKPPYKFLDYYTQDDVDIFCGRDAESQLVFRLALSGRVLTLFGPSGAGKTSLLLAGALPRLEREGYALLYLRALDDPLPALCRAIAERFGGDGATPLPSGDLRAVLAEYLGPKDRLVVVFDQFEELFLHVGSQARRALFQQVAGAVKDAQSDVRFVFSLREDYLARLDEARAFLPDVFTNSFRLKPLDRGNARRAITEPSERAGVEVEAALVDALVGSQGIESGTSGDLIEADGTVPPPALQIVMDRLYRAALPSGHEPDAPPPPDLALSLAHYQDLHGAGDILAGYVDDGLAKLEELQGDDGAPLGADSALGEALLKVMVTSQKTKTALTHDDLLEGLAEAGALDLDDEGDRRRAEGTRLGLERARLLRGFRREGLALYELAHDHIATEIARRINPDEIEAKLARELLSRRLDDWRHAKLLIPRKALELIYECREEIKLSIDALELIFRSTLDTGYKIAYWVKRAYEGGVAVDEFLLQRLESAIFRERASAVTALGHLGERFVAPIIEKLTDDYPQVHVAVIHALERLCPDRVWHEYLKVECYVPAGEFVMGDNNRGRKNEKPARKVHLDAFYIGKYPVTNAEYKRYMDDIGRSFEIPVGKADHPVVNINWYVARDYAVWAGMRLLTEAEWEKAASWDVKWERRKERKRQYPWGDKFDKDKCNTLESEIRGTTPVGKYSPAGDSPYGCADMAGNVWEWTSSLYRQYPYQADDSREDPSYSGSHVLRGGSCYDMQFEARSASRATGHDPYYRSIVSGFRCGLSSTSSPCEPSLETTP